VTTSPHLALTLLPLLLLTAGLVAFYVMRMGPLFREVQQRLDAVNDILQENVAGARLVKAFVRAGYERGRFEAANADMTLRSIAVMQLISTMAPALTLCINAGVVIVIWSGGLSAIEHQLTLGQLVAFSNYLMTTMTPLVMMSMLSNVWAAGFTSLGRMDDILSSVPEVLDAPAAVDVPDDARPEVAFDDVSFTYGGKGHAAALSAVTLAATPGSTVGILGSTGAGKSTLVQLIPRFYDATSGVVSAFGDDVRAWKQDALVRRIGFVPQDSVLFSGTVRDNIRYGRPSASEEEVIAAAKAAQAHDFIVAMADGYDSRIEQRGANLSGGQKQRLAIARALLVEPHVLILDDSTSAVDVETETRIQAALAATREARTTFVVAQRVSTVLDADTIVVLDKGRVVASGHHKELLASSSVYREIWESQLGEGPPA
jgi:ATP-binding cassette subfamily B multidrug efflux pump